jgi:hypothetical protein
MVTNFVRRVHGVGAARLVIAAVSVAVGGLGSACGPSSVDRELPPSITRSPAGAESQICEQFGWTTIGRSYVVQNNRFGSRTATQCINVTDIGFAITTLQDSNPTDDPPVGYPSVYLGCHFGNCSPGSSLPIQVGQISSATSSISYSYVDGGNYDAAYDIFLDPTPKKIGGQQLEIMIHMNRQGSIKQLPRVDETTIGGRSWEVEQGGPWGNGGKEIIYVASSPISAWNFSVLDFINDARNRGEITDAWYLNSIMAGFECWSGCVGLAVNSFSAAVN